MSKIMIGRFRIKNKKGLRIKRIERFRVKDKGN